MAIHLFWKSADRVCSGKDTVRRTSIWIITLLGVAIVGCQDGQSQGDGSSTSNSEVVVEAEQFVLNEEPDGAVGIMELRDRLAEPSSQGESDSATNDGASEPNGVEQVVVIGRIGAVKTSDDRQQKDFPWHPGKAAFVMGDPAHDDTSHQHGDGADHADCPFCNKKAADAQAVVRFLGAQRAAASLRRTKAIWVKG